MRLPYKAKILDTVPGDHSSVRMGLGSFQNALDDAKASLVIKGASMHLAFLRNSVNIILKGEPLPKSPDGEISFHDHCEQLRLRAASLENATLGRKQWPMIADFMENLVISG